MHRLALTIALAAAVTTSACTPGRAAIAAGAGTMLLGGMSFAGGAPNSDCTYGHDCGPIGSFSDSINDDFNQGQRDLGKVLLATGAVLVLIGLVAEANHTESTPPSAVTFAPAQRVIGAPGAVTVGAGPVVERSATPAEMAIRSRIENRLAIQASLTARRGDCRGAVATSVRLAEIDPAMHAELVRTDADLAHCIALAAAQY